MTEDKVYNPGFVKGFQKPWYKTEWPNGIRYCGQFCNAWHDVHLKFDPLLFLVDQIDGNDELVSSIKLLVDEMKDACHWCDRDHIMSLPSAD